MIQISERLKTVASLVTDGNVLADVGTDHGYVPIYLILQKRIARAIAMDINAGPLERAKTHIESWGLSDRIETRRSDGVAALTCGEADSILIAGMGGGLIMHILTEGEAVCQNARELILQPQSEIPLVRAFLQEHHYETLCEEMVLEDGKYYPMMRVRYASHAFSAFEDSADILQGAVDAAQDSATVSQELALRYGALLLAERHPVLFSYLKKEQQTYRAIRAHLEQSPPSEKNKARIHQVDEIIRYNKEALRFFADA